MQTYLPYADFGKTAEVLRDNHLLHSIQSATQVAQAILFLKDMWDAQDLPEQQVKNCTVDLWWNCGSPKLPQLIEYRGILALEWRNRHSRLPPEMTWTCNYFLRQVPEEFNWWPLAWTPSCETVHQRMLLLKDSEGQSYLKRFGPVEVTRVKDEDLAATAVKLSLNAERKKELAI